MRSAAGSFGRLVRERSHVAVLLRELAGEKLQRRMARERANGRAVLGQILHGLDRRDRGASAERFYVRRLPRTAGVGPDGVILDSRS